MKLKSKGEILCFSWFRRHRPEVSDSQEAKTEE